MTVDTPAAYRAATETVALFDGEDRTLLTVTGRSPTQMLKGVITGVMPPVPSEVEGGVFEGRWTYHTVLTPKGKIISDLHATLLGADDEAGYLLDVPPSGREPLLAHFTRFLPPRFAKVTDVSDERARLTVVGPEAAGLLSSLALGLRVDASWLEDADEGFWRCAGDPSTAMLVVRSGDVWPPAYHVHGAADAVEALRSKLVSAGAVEGDAASWEALRVETGRPAFGADMDDGTLPPEAGIVDRAIDHGKGCYTGQEVIVRIRDRGHVNWELRRLDFGSGSAPEPGDELMEADGDKVAARITSVVHSPRANGTLALAYVRRGVDALAFDGRTISVPEGLPGPL